MTICRLGWGSLVWNPGVLRCSGGWRTDGPDLPLEFARTSQDGRLTLVLVEGAQPVPSLWTELEYTSPQQAQEALAGREGCSLAGVGMWPGEVPLNLPGAQAIEAWASTRGFQAVVWTALRPKFGGKNGDAPASAQAAVEYLRALGGEAQARAREYVKRAPCQVRTAFRQAIEQELGWRA